MNERNLKVLGIFAILALVFLGTYFVFAASNAPTALNISFNTTPAYDEGNFTINWTSGGGDAAANYSVFTFVNSSTANVYAAKILNSSALGYNFVNTTQGNYTFIIAAGNASAVFSTETNSTTNISIFVDRTAPLINFSGYTNATAKKNTTQLTLNISVTDGNSGVTGSVCLIDVNGTNQSIPVSNGWCNSSFINLTGLSDGNRTIKVYANDTVKILGLNNSFIVLIDNTAPTASVVCSPRTVYTGDKVTCTCEPSDSGSGINSSLTSITANPSTSDTGTFTKICSFSDLAGNAGSVSDSYTVEQASSISSIQVPVKKSATTTSATTTGTTTPTETASTRASHTFDSITPGVAAVEKDFNPDAGVKEISIEVNNPAQNVEITVTKHDGKPANVSIERTGKLYTYLQIETKNLTDKLSKATITFQIEKLWVVDNNLTKDDVAVSKFDENSSQWNELKTTFSEEDDTFYYYTIDVNSFSYFAIGEKAVVESEGGSKAWVWIVLVLAILGAVAWFLLNRKK